ncbi:MAG: hypothetical protein U0L91_06595 [Gemmiger sp.]|uniref:DUF3592 domain-containing protein n=1 Tax=Gemmiger sp. TaxID=2049027 RepID=UPI002E7821B5|nr:hypothetical protein [Gemmiger sp.]MEE0800935.1 hypothetical protein [Gemmiger sp.]
MSATLSFRIQKGLSWLFATKCGLLGSLFAFLGVVSLAAAVSDLQNSGIEVILFLVPAAVLLGIHAAALRRDRVLLESGRKVTAQADGPLSGVLVHSGPVVYMRHFSVRFHYVVDGVTYHGRSRFYWIAPAVPSDGRLTVCVDPANPRRCAVDLYAA